MRVCHITSAHPWNDVRIFHKQCASLAASGHEVHLVAKDCQGQDGAGVILHSFKSSSNRFQRMLTDVDAAVSLALKVEADVYHLHDPELLRLAGKLLDSKAKVVFDAHEDLPKQILSKHYIPSLIRPALSAYFSRWEKRKTQGLHAVVGATEAISAKFANWTKSVTVSNYPMPGEFSHIQTRSEAAVTSACYAGGISKIRGIEEIIAVAEKLSEVEFHLAGPISNDGSTELIERAVRLPNFFYKGVLSREEVTGLYAECQIGLLPFRDVPNHQGAVPNKMFEYMAAGLLVVANRFESWEFILEKEQAGVFVPFSDVNVTASEIRKLIGEQEKVYKMGLNGQRLVSERFNWDVEYERLRNLYDELERT